MAAARRCEVPLIEGTYTCEGFVRKSTDSGTSERVFTEVTFENQNLDEDPLIFNELLEIEVRKGPGRKLLTTEALEAQCSFVKEIKRSTAVASSSLTSRPPSSASER